MAKEKDSREGKAAPSTERRKQPRTTSLESDWESIALRRVASRVESLPGPQAPGDFGWEEAVLRNLRQRLKDRRSS